MIHDAQVEVSCDNWNNCTNSVFLPCDWNVHGYDLEDSKAERLLQEDQGWIVLNGKHFCCEECKAMVETYES